MSDEPETKDEQTVEDQVTDFGGAKPVTIDEIGISELPDVNEQAIQAELEREEKASGVDSAGTAFNPEIHATDDNGNPTKTKTGLFRKKRGRKAGAAIKTGSAKSVEEIKKQEAAFKSCAIVATQSQQMLMTTIYGEAGNFDNQSEINNTEQVWYNYFKAKGIDDIPPGLAVAICVFSHGVKSHQKETAKPRIEKIKKKFGTWLFEWKVRRDERNRQARREKGLPPKEENGES